MDSHVMEAITFAKISSSGSLLRKKVNLYVAYIKHLKGLLQGSFHVIKCELSVKSVYFPQCGKLHFLFREVAGNL
jgi:hypothetical protein